MVGKPLDLTIFPRSDQHTDHQGREWFWACQACSGLPDEYTTHDKRLTEPELAAEYHAMDSMCRREQWVEAVRDDDYSDSEREGQAKMYDRLNTLHRFATLPHYDAHESGGLVKVSVSSLAYINEHPDAILCINDRPLDIR